jgi:hypothetical protein
MARRAHPKNPVPPPAVEGQTPEVDRRALQILKDTYKTYTGWELEPPLPPPDDYDYARSKGLMFDPIQCSHDDKVKRVAAVCRRVRPREAARAFLASLGGRLEWRSALGCYAVFRHMRVHKYKPKGPTTGDHPRNWCVVCGDFNYPFPKDLNLVNYYRFEQGASEDRPLEAAFILERFTQESHAEPTPVDFDTLRGILRAAASLPAQARANDLEKAVAKRLKTNKYKRQSLLEILSFCGIFQSCDCPGYLHAFVNFEHRGYPPGPASEWGYPMRWWRGSDGVNAEAVKFWFPELG